MVCRNISAAGREAGSGVRLEPVPGEFRICRHFHPRDQAELSQSFDFPIFKRGNQIETGPFKGERVNPTRRGIAQCYSLA
jgi:hypothetical protein